MDRCRLSNTGASLLLLATLCSAIPTPDGDYTKLQQVPADGYQGTPAILELEKTYLKYGWTMSPDMSSAASGAREKVATTPADPSTNSGSYNRPLPTGVSKTVGDVTVEATNASYIVEFLAPVTIGGQTLHLDIDTGCADLWIFNTNIPQDEQGLNLGVKHTIYDHSKSSTYASRPNDGFFIAYADNANVSGTVASETVQIGAISVPNQAIELPGRLSSSSTTDAADGILGLAFQSMNSITTNGQQNPQPTWFENAIPYLDQPLFTANLKVGSTTKYNFGSIDHTSFTGDLVYAPVDSSGGYWEVQSAQFAVGDNPMQDNAGASTALIDTGSSVMFLDQATHDAYYEGVTDAHNTTAGGMTTFPCANAYQLPDLHVAVGNYMTIISKVLMNWRPDDTNPGRCFGGVQTNGPGQTHQVFGDLLFQSYFFVFDYANKQVGFAPHA